MTIQYKLKAITASILFAASLPLYAFNTYATNQPTVKLNMTTNVNVPLTVTHIANNVPSTYSPQCPKAQKSTSKTYTGMSPLADASIHSSVDFFPLGPTHNSNGYIVYRCSESYSSLDNYYQLLKNAKSTPCQSSPSEICSISSDLSGIMPIHFVIYSPSQNIVRNQNMGTFNRVGHITPTSKAYIAKQPYGITIPGTNNSTQYTEFSAVYPVGTTYFLNLIWQVMYSQSDGGGNGYTVGGNEGNWNFIARCPDYNNNNLSSLGYFPLKITSDMLGKTCELSCDERSWHMYGPFNDRGYDDPPSNPPANLTAYFGAPLVLNCH